MLFPISKTPRWVIFLIDIFLSTSSLLIAYFIRFDFQTKKVTLEFWDRSKYSILIFIIIKCLLFFIYKIYQGHIRHTSILDVKRLLLTLGSSTIILFFINFIKARFIDERHLLPTSIIIMEFFISYSLIIGFRYVVKIFYLESINKYLKKKNRS